MSTDRLPKNAGWARNLKKGPNGYNLCRECSTEVTPPRRTFCSEECVHEWKCRTDPGYQAREVLKRDKGVCALCSVDCELGLRQLKDAPYGELHPLMERFGLKRFNRWALRIWDMDHTTPVIEGGGSCGLENLRTLCKPCHKQETAKLAARLAQARRDAVVP